MNTQLHLSDRYELGEILGFGGMSEVHMARDLRLDRDVAVKVLRADLARNPGFYLRFRREAQNAAALNHPAIVAVYDTGEAQTDTGPLPYIVMEYVDGITLRDILNKDGPVPPRKAIEIIADACQALNFSHQHGIIHRDVKPANIMISRAGAVKVMDFGIAHALADSGNVTRTGAVLGTAQYLSPEQARGESVDARSDVYSLGCVLYEILTGEPPFIGDSPLAVAYQHVRKPPEPPSQKQELVSTDLDAVVLQALAKNPENRYQTAAEMRADLVRVYSGESPDAPKVLTEAERTSLLSKGGPRRAHDRGREPRYIEVRRSGRGSLARWMTLIAALTVLTILVTVLINLAPGWLRNAHTVEVPDVAGQPRADAVVALQKAGFEAKTQQVTDPEVAPDRVVSTDPKAGASITSGSTVTLNVSVGAEQRLIPDVADLTYEDAVRRLAAAGFGKVKLVRTPSTLEQKDKVIGTDPVTDQTAPVTFEIAVLVGSGPEMVSVPDLIGQKVDDAQTNLRLQGFAKPPQLLVDSPKPAGEVTGINPAAGQRVPKGTVIQLQVSKGNQFLLPDLTGKFWDDLLPQLQSYGWTGVATTEVTPAGDDNRARVIRQDPPPNTPVRRDGTIKLTFGE